MSILPVVKEGDPVLRRPAGPVEKVTAEVKRLIGDMFQTMYAAPGVGLAAVQIGVPLRVIVLDTGQEDGGPLAIVNPEIVSKDGSATSEEGCLSLPGLYVSIKRAMTVTVTGLNQDGQPVTIRAQGLRARALQHEVDHINGILIIDHLPFWQRMKAHRQIAEWKRDGVWGSPRQPANAL